MVPWWFHFDPPPPPARSRDLLRRIAPSAGERDASRLDLGEGLKGPKSTASVRGLVEDSFNLVDVGRGAKIQTLAVKWGFPTKPQ